MASPRYLFGSGASDFAIAPPSRHGGFVVSAASLGNGTLWSAATGGSQYTDLQTVNGGAMSTISTDKDGGLVPFYGPAGIDSAWLDFGGGSRAFISASHGQDTHVADLLGDDASAATAALATRGDSRWPRRDRLWLNAKDYGAVGNGVADDTTALQSFLNALKTAGGTGYIPAGTYNTTAQLSITSGTKPFQIFGAGKMRTTIVRASDFGTVWQITSTDDWSVENLTIDGGYSTYTTAANHGFIAQDCSRAALRHVEVRNHKNSAILVYASTPGTDSDFTIDFCDAIGNGATTNNGILLASMRRSFIRNCTARDILGSPGIGLQLKNQCVNSGIINGYAENCDDGYSFGGDTPGLGPSQCLSSNLHAYDCVNGLAIGEAYNNVYNGILIDCNNKAGLLRAMAIDPAARDQVVKGVHILNVPTGVTPVRLDGQGCRVEIDHIATTATGAVVSSTPAAGATRNHVVLDRVVQAGSTVIDSYPLVTWNDSTANFLDFTTGSNNFRKAISSDAITIPHGRDTQVLLDSEGAAATDNLQTINGGQEGQRIFLSARLDSQDITVKHNLGNIILSGTDFVLDNSRDVLQLIYHGNIARWVEVSRSNNGA